MEKNVYSNIPNPALLLHYQRCLEFEEKCVNLSNKKYLFLVKIDVCCSAPMVCGIDTLAKLHLISTCFLAIICLLLHIEDANTSPRSHSSNNCLVIISGSFGRSLWENLLLLKYDFQTICCDGHVCHNSQFNFKVIHTIYGSESVINCNYWLYYVFLLYEVTYLGS